MDETVTLCSGILQMCSFFEDTTSRSERADQTGFLAESVVGGSTNRTWCNGSVPLVEDRQGGAFWKGYSSCPLARRRRENFGDIDCKSLHLGPEIDATHTLLTATYMYVHVPTTMMTH